MQTEVLIPLMQRLEQEERDKATKVPSWVVFVHFDRIFRDFMEMPLRPKFINGVLNSWRFCES